MTHEQRDWMLKAITNCFELVVFEHEQQKLEMMMAKYVDEKIEISAQELAEDMIYLDKIYG